MIRVADRAETTRLEKSLIEEWGMPQLLLMERAALGISSLVESLYPPQTPVTALVGPGNNGADALAVCRLLLNRGYRPRALRVGEGGSAAAESQKAWLAHYGLQLDSWRPEETVEGLLLDGLFGFGLARAPEGPFAEAIHWANRQPAKILAVDLPSGILADTGCAPGLAIRADWTVACGVLKRGLLSDPILPYLGELFLADIGFPPHLLASLPGGILPPPSLPPRPPMAYKGSQGSLLIVGGSSSMSGAPTMALRAAIRSGAGLVYALVPAPIRDVVAGAVPEGIVLPLPEDPSEAFESVREVAARCQAALVGPGLADSALAERCWRDLALPTVFDAGALLPQLAGQLRSAPALLTPHPGEAARLLSLPSSEVQSDRLRAARALSARFGAPIVLKGARTLLADGQEYRILADTSPLLATAGSGDVLSGLLAGLLAQGLAPLDAAGTALALQGRMARIAEADGRKTLPALELLSYFDRALAPIPEPTGTLVRI